MSMRDENGFHTVRGYELLEKNKNKLTYAMEDYLEMIYRIGLEEPHIRINTLSMHLNVQAPSVTKMVQRLGQVGLLQYEKYGLITLTDDGKEIGKYLYHRHYIVEAFLVNLGVKKQLLEETERMEHTVSAETLDKIELFNRFLDINQSIHKKFLDFSK